MQFSEVRTGAFGVVGRRRHRREAQNRRIELEEAGNLVRRDARLALLGGEIDLEEGRDLEPARGRLGIERVDELTDALTAFALRLWRCPMKCQRKASPWAACLASRSCALFSPTTSIPASARTAISPTETYFVAATIVTSGPTSSLTRASRSRTCSAEKANDALCAARPSRAALGEEEVWAAGRAEVDSLDIGGSGALAAIPRRSRGRAFRRARRGAEPLAERAGHVLSNLVTTGADRRSNDCRQPAAQLLCCGRDDSVQEAAPAGVKHRKSRRVAVRAGEGDQPAIGAEGDDRHARLVGPEPVPGIRVSRFRTVDGRGMRLVPERELLLVCAERGAEAPAVLVYPGDVVSGLTAQVERSKGPSLTPPRRVEKTTSHRAPPSGTQGASRALDQLPRGGELGVPPVELAVQLAAAKLVENLPHARRLGEAEVGHVGACDLEADSRRRSK